MVRLLTSAYYLEIWKRVSPFFLIIIKPTDKSKVIPLLKVIRELVLQGNLLAKNLRTAGNGKLKWTQGSACLGSVPQDAIHAGKKNSANIFNELMTKSESGFSLEEKVRKARLPTAADSGIIMLTATYSADISWPCKPLDLYKFIILSLS